MFRPLISQDYGPNEYWCFMNRENSQRNILFTIFNFYAEIWVAILVNVVLIYSVFQLLKQINVNHNFDFIPNIHKLIWFPIFWIVSWFFASLNTILMCFNLNIFALHCVHLILGSLIGFFNAILFGYNKSLLNALKLKICCLETAEPSEIETPLRSIIRDEFMMSTIWNVHKESLNITNT